MLYKHDLFFPNISIFYDHKNNWGGGIYYAITIFIKTVIACGVVFITTIIIHSICNNF